jgi:hypothetical protein
MVEFILTEQYNVILVHANGQSNGEKNERKYISSIILEHEQEWGREMHTDQWNSNERSGLA